MTPRPEHVPALGGHRREGTAAKQTRCPLPAARGPGPGRRPPARGGRLCLCRAFGRARLRPEATCLPRGSPPAVPPVPPRPGPAREGHEPGVQRPDTRMRAPAAAQASAFPGSEPARSAPLSPRCVPPAFRENCPPRHLARPPTPASARWWKTLADRHARPSAAAGPTPMAGCGANPPTPPPALVASPREPRLPCLLTCGHHQHAADAPRSRAASVWSGRTRGGGGGSPSCPREAWTGAGTHPV